MYCLLRFPTRHPADVIFVGTRFVLSSPGGTCLVLCIVVHARLTGGFVVYFFGFVHSDNDSSKKRAPNQYRPPAPSASQLRYHPDLLNAPNSACRLQISEPAVRSLIKGYLDMRNMVGRGTKTISATPRQLESLIRLSEGLAKMRHAR